MAQSILLSVAEQRRLQRRAYIQRLRLRAESQPLMMPENDFIGYYRLRKADFERLCADVSPLLPPVNHRTRALRPEIRILAALAFYANGCYQKNVGAFYHLALAQSTVSHCLRDVTNALNHPNILAKYIQFPRNRTEREDVSRRFMEVFDFPGVIGCIDGTHVAIIRPCDHEEAYFNRKHYHSLNVLLICDADLRILHVDASFGGQSHDSHVWNGSPVKALMQDLHDNGEVCWLLGDSGYAQRPWMMTPVINAVPNSPEQHYTDKHVRTRNVVERCIGVLKTRWRCLLVHRVMHYDPTKAGRIVNSCIVLHNLMTDRNNISIDEDDMTQDLIQQPLITPPANEQIYNIDGGRQAVVDRLWRSQHLRTV